MALSALRNAYKLTGACNTLKPGPYFMKTLAPFSQFPNANRGAPLPAISNRTSLLQCPPTKLTQFACGASTSSDHSKLWVIEKVISLALIPIVPLGIVYPNALFDNIFVLLTVPHIHWGLENVCHDYIRVVLFGEMIPKVAATLVYVISAFLLGALFYFNFSDIGMGRFCRKLWAVNK